MVRFCSGKSTIQLSVADLEKTTGTDAETWQNAQQRSNIQQCNLEFAKESPNGILPWVYINDPKDGMSTHFLGKNKHIPFLMAQAGYNIVSATTSETRNTRPGRIPVYDQENSDEERRTRTATYTSLDRERVYTPPSKPQALCLTVFLDPKAFISLEPKEEMTKKDIKIDAFCTSPIPYSSDIFVDVTNTADFGIEPVYLNGQFFDSELIRHRYATRNGATTKQIVCFTGSRIDRVIEKPWIIVPSGQDPDGTPAQDHDRGSNAPSRRWHAISNAILFAADRAGRNKDGQRSALGEYLESLASLPMPPEVASVQKVGSANFGVIDVVISWAKGAKTNLTEPYLSRPMLAIVEGYEYVEPVDLLVETPAKGTTSRLSSPDTAPRTPTGISAGTDLFDDSAKDTTTSYGIAAAYPSPTSCARTPPTSIAPAANIGSSITGRSYLAASSSRKRTRSASIPGPESQFKRPKQTLEQEIAYIQKKAEEDNRQRKALKAGPQPIPSGVRRKNGPINMKEYSPDGNMSSDSISLVEMKDKTYTPEEGKFPKDSVLSARMKDETDTPRLSQKAKLKLPPSAMKLRQPKKVKSSKEKGKKATPETVKNPRQISGTKVLSSGEPHDTGFEVPELSRDCVITYAPPGLVRNVRTARKTFLVEEGAVIVGARFIVG